jgi:predicted nucleic acid-binding protein
MLYLDANVFIYAALNQEDIGERARSLLREVQRGKLPAASSTLTFHELVWAVKRYGSFEDAITAGEAFMSMPGLKLVDVDDGSPLYNVCVIIGGYLCM